MTSKKTASICEQFDFEADPRVAQGIADLRYSGYTRSAFQEAMQAGANTPKREASDAPQPAGAFGSC